MDEHRLNYGESCLCDILWGGGNLSSQKTCIFLGRQTINTLWVAHPQDTLIYSTCNAFSLGQGEENLLHMSSVSANAGDYNYVLMLIQLLRISCCNAHCENVSDNINLFKLNPTLLKRADVFKYCYKASEQQE